ncbi:uncharacterized protein FA14DRAFT_136596, partial [Meira miltonrushii]
MRACPIKRSYNIQRSGAFVRNLSRPRSSASLQRGGIRPATVVSQVPRPAVDRSFSMHATQPLYASPSADSHSVGNGDYLPKIELTPIESAICQLLDDACRWIEKHQPQPDPERSENAQVDYRDGWTCEARIAGGWVRDKLLGQASHDLDVSLSSLTGYVFALFLEAYLLSPEFLQSDLAQNSSSPFHAHSSETNQLVGHITKIAANPDQSKNLETATAIVAGLSLDFVNLRKEVYVGNSRIPIMTFGTALEDAERRDITINSLFYNVHTRLVEDFTGKGLSDMRDRIIRTPLEPQQTFLDDPLRVLRCVRFASRLGYIIDQEIFSCLKDERGAEIRLALSSKVSRERFGIEVNKMMLGPDPAGALALIEKMHLYDVVFGPPPGEIIRASKLGHEEVERAVLLLAAIRTIRDEHGIADIPFLSNIKDDEESQRLLYYSAALLPLRSAEWEEKKGKWQWAGACVILRGLKLAVRQTREPLICLWKSANILHRPTKEVFDPSNEQYRGRFIPSLGSNKISDRATRALLARHPELHRTDIGVTIELRLLWSLISDLTLDESLWSSSTPSAHEAEKALQSHIAESYYDFYRQLEEEGLLSRIDERVILDGKEILETLQVKPGALMSIITKQVEAWQFDRDLRNHSIEDAKTECKQWLRSEWDRGGIVPLDERAAKP